MPRTRTRRSIGVCAGVLAGALALAGSTSATATPAPTAPADAEKGIVHVKTKPAFGEWQVVHEVWYKRDGSGWQMRRTGRGGETKWKSGETSWVADRQGIRISSSGGVGGPSGVSESSPAELARLGDADYLTRPWVDLAIDPMARVARGEMKIVGQATINGEAASELVYANPKRGGSGHYFVAKDDGALLRAQTFSGVVDVETYEVLPASAYPGQAKLAGTRSKAKLAGTRDKAGHGRSRR